MDDLNKEARLLEKLAAIRESFLQRTRGELPLLRDLLGRIQAGDTTGLRQLQSFAHRIRGSGASFDFAAVSESAAKVEGLLEVLIGASGVTVVEPHDMRCLVECGQRLVSEIGAATTQGLALG